MKSLWIRAMTLVLLLLVCHVDQTMAQEAGDRVVAKAETTLRRGRTVLATVAAETLLVVEKTQGQWLLVRSPAAERGWVLKTAVRPAPASAPPDDREPRRATEPVYDDLADADLVPGELVVTLHKDARRDDLEEALKSLRHEARILETIAAAHTYLVSVPNDVLHECRLRLGVHPYVEGCGLNTVCTLTRTYNDPALEEDSDLGWNLRRINVFDAWDTTTGGAKIAIVDSGVYTDHAEFRDKLVSPYSEFTRSSSFKTGLVQVKQGDELVERYITDHGTHVAGTAAGSAGNGIGTAGVAPDSPIMPIQILSYFPNTQTIHGVEWSAIRGLNRAMDEGAKVINYSVGDVPPEELINAWRTARSAEAEASAEAQMMNWVRRRLNDDYLGLLDRAVREGVILVKAAGNADLPAKFDHLAYSRRVISVAATNEQDGRAIFHEQAASNYGEYTTVSAPGQEIWNAHPDPMAPYVTKQGTSMAAPHVAGLLGLMKTIDPDLSRVEAADILVTTGRKLTTDKPIGPLVNAAAAVQEVKRRREEGVPRPEVDPPLIARRPNPANPALPRDGVAILRGPRPWLNPDVRRLIDLWLSIALPVLGNRNPADGPFFFDRFGRVISIRIVYTILPPDYAANRYQWLWTNADTLVSSNFGTLNVFVLDMMQGGNFNPNPSPPGDQIADNAADPAVDYSGNYAWANGVYAGFCTSFNWKQNRADAATVTFNMDGRLAPLLKRHGLPATVNATVKRAGDSYVMVGDPLGTACSTAVTNFEKAQGNPKQFTYKLKIAFTPAGKAMNVKLDAVSSDPGATGSFPGAATRK